MEEHRDEKMKLQSELNQRATQLKVRLPLRFPRCALATAHLWHMCDAAEVLGLGRG